MHTELCLLKLHASPDNVSAWVKTVLVGILTNTKCWSKSCFSKERDVGICYCRLLLHDDDDSFRCRMSVTPVCDCSDRESAEHFLFHCSKYAEVICLTIYKGYFTSKLKGQCKITSTESLLLADPQGNIKLSELTGTLKNIIVWNFEYLTNVDRRLWC